MEVSKAIESLKSDEKKVRKLRCTRKYEKKRQQKRTLSKCKSQIDT